jgi:hypothetical protein
MNKPYLNLFLNTPHPPKNGNDTKEIFTFYGFVLNPF